MRTVGVSARRTITPRLAAVMVATVALMTMTNTLQGAVVGRVLDASLTSGSLAGTQFAASSSYDDSSLTGQGTEYLPLLSFNFTLGAASFTRDDIFQGGQAIFQDGVLRNVTAAFFPEITGRPPAAPVRSIVFGFGTDRGIAYTDLDGGNGDGSFSFEDTGPTIVERVLDASLTSGSLADTEFTASFSYDVSNLSGQGTEYLPLLSFNFTLGAASFTRDDIFQGGQAIFQDGVLQNVTAAFFPEITGRPPAAPVRSIVFGFGTDRGIAYTDLDGGNGDGSFSFEDPAP